MGDAVLVGTVTLDVLHEGPLGAGRPPVVLRWGGVMNNVACSMAARGLPPVLVTARYTGELAASVAHHLAGHRVRWHALPVAAPIPLFHAQLVDGSVHDKHFLGEDALAVLSPALLSGPRHIFDAADVLVAGTDCHEPALAWLAERAAGRGIPFWLLSADPTEVGKLRPGGRRADLVALNLPELSARAGRPLTDRAQIVAAAAELPAEGGRCLVTLGGQGALLVHPATGQVLFEPAPARPGTRLAVGAGDVMFACLLTARLAGLDWPRALRHASRLTGDFLDGLEGTGPDAVGTVDSAGTAAPAGSPYAALRDTVPTGGGRPR